MTKYAAYPAIERRCTLTNQDSTQKENQQKTAALKSPYQETEALLKKWASDHGMQTYGKGGEDAVADLKNRIASLIQRFSNEALERRDPWRKDYKPEPRKDASNYRMEPYTAVPWDERKIIFYGDKKVASVGKRVVGPHKWFWYKWDGSHSTLGRKDPQARTFPTPEAAFESFLFFETGR